MDTVFAGLATGFGVALTPFNLLLVAIGCFSGMLIGALPGIGPINGVAILLPIAFSMGFPPESALILLNVPGDAGASKRDARCRSRPSACHYYNAAPRRALLF